MILDWVANHTSPDARWIEERPADWYVRDSLGNTIVQYDWTDIAKLDYGNADMRAARRPPCVSGSTAASTDSAATWRCSCPWSFWNEAARRLRKVNPGLFLLAEAEEPYLFEAGAFDACYAWEMHHLMNDVAQQKVRVTALRDYIYADRNRYPQSAMRLVFTSNHDENSWNGSEFTRMGAPARSWPPSRSSCRAACRWSIPGRRSATTIRSPSSTATRFPPTAPIPFRSSTAV